MSIEKWELMYETCLLRSDLRTYVNIYLYIYAIDGNTLFCRQGGEKGGNFDKTLKAFFVFIFNTI